MPKRIAILDDDTTFQTLLEELLRDEGYEPHGFTEAAAALPHLRALDPAAILLDLRLHGDVNGWQVLDRVKADPRLTATPLIMCSADVPQLRALEASLHERGCAILAKPFNLEELLSLLEQVTGGAG